MLNPNATNKMTCTVCGWTRIIDHTRGYRGGHTDPDKNIECNGMLKFEEVAAAPPMKAGDPVKETDASSNTA